MMSVCKQGAALLHIITRLGLSVTQTKLNSFLPMQEPATKRIASPRFRLHKRHIIRSAERGGLQQLVHPGSDGVLAA